MKKLYHVYSIANSIPYKKKNFDNVNINWFVIKRKKTSVPFEEAIINYANLNKKQRKGPEKYIKEQFTYEEAKTLKEYLLNAKNMITQIEEINLPVADSKKDYLGMKFKGETTRHVLYKEKNYQLPFKVVGIYNVDTAYDSNSGDETDTAITFIPEELRKDNTDNLEE